MRVQMIRACVRAKMKYEGDEKNMIYKTLESLGESFRKSLVEWQRCSEHQTAKKRVG